MSPSAALELEGQPNWSEVKETDPHTLALNLPRSSEFGYKSYVLASSIVHTIYKVSKEGEKSIVDPSALVPALPDGF